MSADTPPVTVEIAGEDRALPKLHVCPKGHSPLIARCLADSDDRIYWAWWQCSVCGWKSKQSAVAARIAPEGGDG